MMKQQGTGLVELMVAITLSLIVLLAVVDLFISSNSNTTRLYHSIRLQQELETTMDMMVGDIRRAGYWRESLVQVNREGDLTLSAGYNIATTDVTASNPTGDPNVFLALSGNNLGAVLSDSTTARAQVIAPTPSPGASATATIEAPFSIGTLSEGDWYVLNPFQDISIDNSNECILFSSDLNDDGVVDVSTSDAVMGEQMGFRLNNTDKSVEMRISGEVYNCNDVADNHWQAISNNNVEITELQFTITPTTLSSGINKREVTITLNGRLRAHTEVTAQLTKTVYVQNDAFIP
tara:strand:- start:79942 stop:80817 length:876 start_codon:yes stop_codon:yes gene_type:complete